MRQVTDTPGRLFPRAPRIPPKDPEGDRERVLERIVDQQQRNIRELDRSVFGDVRDRVVVRSRGMGKEVKVHHRMPVKPTDYLVLNQTGGGSISQSRSSLADSEFAYFKVHALAGVKFKVMLGVLEPINGVGEEEFIVEDEDPEEVPEDDVKPGGKGKKKPGKSNKKKD